MSGIYHALAVGAAYVKDSIRRPRGSPEPEAHEGGTYRDDVPSPPPRSFTGLQEEAPQHPHTPYLNPALTPSKTQTSRRLRYSSQLQQREDERRLLGDYRSPADATPILLPGSAPATMPFKAFGGFIPKNTLSEQKFSPQPKAHRGGGNHPSSGLHIEPLRGDNVRLGAARTQPRLPDFPDHGHSSKRRKMTHSSPPQTPARQEVIELDRDNESEPLVTVERGLQSSSNKVVDEHSFPPPGTYTSQQSTRTPTRQPLSQEFYDVERKVKPPGRRDVTRPETSHECAVGSNAIQRSQGRRDAPSHGLTQDTPLLIEDDEPPRKDVFSKLIDILDPEEEKHETATKRQRLSGGITKSPFFSDHSKTNSRHATVDPEVVKVQDIDAHPIHGTSAANKAVEGNQPSLYRVFKRDAEPPRIAGILHEDIDIDNSIDELAMPETVVTRVRNDGTSYRPQQTQPGPTQEDPLEIPESPELHPHNAHSTVGDIPSAKFNRAGNTENNRGRHSASWKLRTFRNSPDAIIEAEPALSLVFNEKEQGHSFFSLLKDGETLHSDCNIPLKLIDRSIWCDDGDCRLVRLAGRDRFGYPFDLEFQNHDVVESFIRYLGGVGIRRYTKTSSEMQKMFERYPLDRFASSKFRDVVDSGVEQNLMEQRASRRKQLESVARDTREAAQLDRPKKATRLLSQLQASVPTGHRPAQMLPPVKYESDEPNVEADRKYAARLTAEGSTRSRPIRSTRSMRRYDTTPEAVNAIPYYDKFSQKHGLGEKWEQPVVYPQTGKKRTTVEFSDLERLDEGEFLNDNLIEFYMRWLQEQFATQDRQVYFFGTHFYTALSNVQRGQKGINYPAVDRWTAKDDIFSHDFVILPVNEATHWYLAIICNLPNVERKLALDDEIIDLDGSESPNKKRKPDTRGFLDQTADHGERSSLDLQQPPVSEEVRVKYSQMSIDDGEETPAGADCKNAVNLGASEQDEKNGGIKENRHGDTTNSDLSKVESRVTPEADHSQLNESQVTDTGVFSHVKANSPISKRKSKRKSGPPPRKYETDKPMIVILDSLGGTHAKTISNLKDYLVEEGRSKRAIEVARDVFQGMHARAGIPMQENFSDCGVFVCGYAHKFMMDPKSFGAKLLAQEFDVTEDWPDMNPSHMRASIREMLQDIAKQQTEERRIRKAAKRKAKLAATATSAATSPSQPSSPTKPPVAPIRLSEAGVDKNIPKGVGEQQLRIEGPRPLRREEMLPKSRLYSGSPTKRPESEIEDDDGMLFDGQKSDHAASNAGNDGEQHPLSFLDQLRVAAGPETGTQQEVSAGQDEEWRGVSGSPDRQPSINVYEDNPELPERSLQSVPPQSPRRPPTRGKAQK